MPCAGGGQRPQQLVPAHAGPRGCSQQLPEDQEGHGDNQSDRERRIDLHRVPPFELPDRVPEYRRQNRTSGGLAARPFPSQCS